MVGGGSFRGPSSRWKAAGTKGPGPRGLEGARAGAAGEVGLGPRHCGSPGALSECSDHCSFCLSMRDGAQHPVAHPQGKKDEISRVSMGFGAVILGCSVPRGCKEEQRGGRCPSGLKAVLKVFVCM